MVRLGDVCEVIIGATPKTEVPQYWGGDIVWVTPTDLGKLTDKVIIDSERHITNEGYNAANTNMIPQDSIVLSTRAPIGHLAISGVRLCTNQGCKGIVPSSSVDSRFLYYYLLLHKTDLAALGSGATFKELSTLSLRSYEIPRPPLDEQRRIAAEIERELAIVEKARQAATEQLEAARALNAAYLREVFEGNDWEMVEIDDLCILGRGRVISKQEIEKNKGDYPVYSSQTSNNGVFGYIDTYDFEGEYVTWTTDGAKAGTVFYRNGRFNCTNVCGTLKAKNPDTIDMRFLSFSLGLFTKTNVFIASGNPKLMNNIVARIEIPMPDSVSEQRQAVEFIEARVAKTSKAIAAIQTQLDTINAMPAAILRQAFGG
jgi:type I restriction enzyme S subunit